MQYINYKGFKVMLQGYIDGWLIVSVDEKVLKLPNFAALDTYLLTNTKQLHRVSEHSGGRVA